jgi:hypothetical protein
MKIKKAIISTFDQKTVTVYLRNPEALVVLKDFIEHCDGIFVASVSTIEKLPEKTRVSTPWQAYEKVRASLPFKIWRQKCRM